MRKEIEIAKSFVHTMADYTVGDFNPVYLNYCLLMQYTFPSTYSDLVKYIDSEEVDFNVDGNKVRLSLMEYLNSDLFKN